MSIQNSRIAKLMEEIEAEVFHREAEYEMATRRYDETWEYFQALRAIGREDQAAEARLDADVLWDVRVAAGAALEVVMKEKEALLAFISKAN